MLADAGQLRQVFDNLVTNALEHSDASTIVVHATSDHDCVKVKVDDDGIGVGSSAAERAFDRLWQADPARSRTRAGHGLGLTIARRLVELHDGTLTLHSRAPQGTSCQVQIPTIREECGTRHTGKDSRTFG